MRVEGKTSFSEPFPGSGTSYSKPITGDRLSKETKTEEAIAVIRTNYNPVIHLISAEVHQLESATDPLCPRRLQILVQSRMVTQPLPE